MAAKGVISKPFLEKYGYIGKWYLWSARFLLGNIVIQFFKLWRDAALARGVDGLDSKETKSPSENPSKDHVCRNKQEDGRRFEDREWWKSLTANTIWIPLCVHWSVDGGIGIPANLAGIFSFLAGAWGLHDLWKQTREM